MTKAEKRTKAIKSLKNILNQYESHGLNDYQCHAKVTMYLNDKEALKMAIESLEPVTPIRPTCKDCKWKSRDIDFRNLKCPWGECVEMTDNDFCSRYERR